MKINTIIAALAMASSALSAAMPGSRYYITGTRTLEPTTTSRPRQYYITGTRTLPGFISVAARETGAALEAREDIDISTYAGRGIDLAGLPKCHQMCFFTARWDKFDVINLPPEKFCDPQKLFYWESYYLGPCVYENCPEGNAAAREWFWKTCPKESGRVFTT